MSAFSNPAFGAGMLLCLSLIMSIGPQNAHVLRIGLQGGHVGLTVAICIVADVALIALGVLGLAQLGGLSDKLHGALVGAGAVFLLVYGWQALRRFIRPPVPAVAAVHALDGPSLGKLSRWQASAQALAFSWLNPHAWLDTAVLIGTASLAYGPAGSTAFGAGAAAGSLLWFGALGLSVFWLGRRLASPRIWRALDGLVALMMWGTALWLVLSLL